MIIGMDHQTPGENANPTFEHAHIYVLLEAGYILALEKGHGECHRGNVSAA